MGSYVDKTSMFSMLAIVIAMVALLIVRGPISDSWAISKSEIFATAALPASATTITLESPSIYTTPTGGGHTGNYADPQIPSKGFSVGGVGCKRSDFSSPDGISIAVKAEALRVAGCTISYVSEDTESQGYITLLLQLLPFLIVAGVVAGSVLARGARAQQGFSGGGSGFGMGQAISLIIALVLLPIITKFTTDATEAYAVIPSYFGVGLMLGLVILGYVLGIILDVTGQLGPGAVSKMKSLGGGSSNSSM